MVAKGNFTGSQALLEVRMHFVYVLLSRKDHKYYIGYTDNVESRIKKHNQGSVPSTKKRRPFDLIYYEAYVNVRDAEGREKFLKSGSGHRYLKKQLKYYGQQALSITPGTKRNHIPKRQKT